MKKIMIPLALLIITPSYAAEEKILTADLIDFIDGKPWGINDEVIGIMLQVRINFKKAQIGESLRGESTEGIFPFRDQMYNIRALARLESNIEREFYQKQDELLKSHTKNKEALQQLEQEYHTLKKELKEVLSIAKKEFERLTSPFINGVRNTKEHMSVLFKEWSEKRNRPDSIILDWASSEETETSIFNTKITSFKDLDTFSTDLIRFLEDLIHSCPVGWAQFKQRLQVSKKST